MPLKEGSSRKVVGENIKTEEAEGKKPKQAIAIALSNAGLSRSDSHKRHPATGHYKMNPRR